MRAEGPTHLTARNDSIALLSPDAQIDSCPRSSHKDYNQISSLFPHHFGPSRPPIRAQTAPGGSYRAGFYVRIGLQGLWDEREQLLKNDTPRDEAGFQPFGNCVTCPGAMPQAGIKPGLWPSNTGFMRLTRLTRQRRNPIPAWGIAPGTRCHKVYNQISPSFRPITPTPHPPICAQTASSGSYRACFYVRIGLQGLWDEREQL